MTALGSSSSRRRAATAVETAVVIGVALLFLLGLFEYGRFFMAKHMLENSAREGARFAVSHTSDPTSDVTGDVKNFLCGLDAKLQNCTITVQGVKLRNSDGTPTTAKGQPLSSGNWYDASPTDGIKVSITAQYVPILPAFLHMETPIQMTATAVMYSEGN
jgi:Flp pilus assembly protein TadG